MRLATVKQSRDIDELSQKVYGLTGEILMESAGALAAKEVDQAFLPELQRGLCAVVCGPGNNGGDGLVLARHMHSAGHRDIKVFLIAPKDRQSPLFKIQLKRAELQGLKIIDLHKDPERLEQLRSAGLIVDAVFGIGLSRKVEGEFLKAMDMINSVKVPVVSLDCPSGLDCDRGVVVGTVIRAAMTLSFGLAKPGFFVADGPAHVGKLRVLHIGFPFEALRGTATTHFLFTEKLARRYLPSRKNVTNKSDFGHVLVVAGSRGMWGAGILSASSAYRIGAGYVTWASFEMPEAHLKDAPEVLSAQVDDPELWSKKLSAVAIGPGLGVGQRTADLIVQLREKGFKSVVLDADAITTCVEHDLFPLPGSWVITPHAGELSRILLKEAREIEKDRYLAALEATQITGCHVLLKGFRSILAYGERCMVINSGNSALAKAGTGDVLTGMIAGLMAQGLDTVQATATAAYIHGRMADEWVRVGNDKSALVASDLKDHLPQLIARISGGVLF